MAIVSVKSSLNYDVEIGFKLLSNSINKIKTLIGDNKAYIITDDVVGELYSDKLINSLASARIDCKRFVFAHGEKSKTLKTYGEIMSFLADSGATRQAVLIGLGGGVVGDITGFAAATYMRGVKYINIPTTLLSGIDSSVGGKTAVDIAEGKNLVGAFYPPCGVFFDIETLNSLPEREWKNGLGELVKYGVLMGGELWKNLQSGLSALKNNCERVVELAVSYKRDIVERDEKEGGVRKLLNLGHTIAHGVELLSNYTVPHGEAVAVGLYYILRAQLALGEIDKSVFDEIVCVMDAFKLNYKTHFSLAELICAAHRDKKSDGEFIDLVAVKKIGDCYIKRVKLNKLEEYFNEDIS